MATAEFSSVLSASIHSRVFNGNTAQINLNNSIPSSQFVFNMWTFIPVLPLRYGFQSVYTGTNVCEGRLIICKGIVPTDFTTLTAYNSRSTDFLVTFTSGDYPAKSHFINGGTTADSTGVSLTTTLVSASATGTASWFWLQTISPQAYSATAGVSFFHSIVGTVGLAGSGSDLEISDTNIVSGTAYRVLNLKFKIPSTYTY